MTDTDTSQVVEAVWSEKPLNEAQMKARANAELIPVTRTGAVPLNFAQMVDYAKIMSTARGAVGAHLMGNVGGCMAVMEIANQFNLPAYAVARQSYLVNGRIAFMGQFFHSIIEDHCPLQKGPNGRKLQWRIEGEGPEMRIYVSATFIGASEPVVYKSPLFKDIKVKNSPLWFSEPERQFVYFGVRGWQTMYWSEGMMHAITGEEAAALPPSEYARDVTPLANEQTDKGKALLERLAAGRRNGDHAATEEREGFKEGHAERETNGHHPVDDVAKDTKPEAAQPAADAPQAESGKGRKPRKKSTAATETLEVLKDDPKDETKSDPKDAAGETIEHDGDGQVLPKNPAEWKVYATAWIDAAKADPKITKRDMQKWWDGDRKLRNDCGVTADYRASSGVEPLYAEVFHDKAD